MDDNEETMLAAELKTTNSHYFKFWLLIAVTFFLGWFTGSGLLLTLAQTLLRLS